MRWLPLLGLGSTLLAADPIQPVLPREALVQDVRQLERLLEDRHPDPYTAFGGPLGFHRRLDGLFESIPEEGLNLGQFKDRVQAFLAGLRDGHTTLRLEAGDPTVPGLPLRFRVIEDQLVVSAVVQEHLRPLLGARLETLQTLGVERLRVRQTALRGHENLPGERQGLANSLATSAGLQRLVPAWRPGDRLTARLILPDGTSHTVALDPLGPRSPAAFPSSRVKLPSYSKGALAWGFLDETGKMAILRIRDCLGYRECLEWGLLSNPQWALREARRIFKDDTGREPATQEELLAHLPSALEAFADLARAMKARGTRDLLVDLRTNTGGHARISDLLVYVLFGEAGLGRIRPGYSIPRNPDTGEYDFRSERAYRAGKPQGPKPLSSVIEKGSPVVDREIQEARLAGLYAPRVHVLTSAQTYSAGYMIARDLQANGARLVGTPSGQAGNAFMDPRPFRLVRSGLEGSITSRAIRDFPEDPRGQVLAVDIPLTYARLRDLAFDPHAEVLLALEAALPH